MKRFFQEESGTNLAEYSLLLALVALVVLGVVVAIGISVSNLFDNPDLFDALT